MKKKIWKKPELVVLLRNRPEEDVLVQCKTERAGNTPGTSAQMCGNNVAGNCRACQARGGHWS